MTASKKWPPAGIPKKAFQPYSLFSRFDKRWVREDHGSPPA